MFNRLIEANESVMNLYINRKQGCMFTPEAFKDLLTPLLEDLLHQSIRLPLKNSTSFDFSADLSHQISECGLDPKGYVQELKTLSLKRNVCLPDASAPNATEMFHYFLELEHISHRFGVTSLSKSLFTWSDSLKPDISGSQSSLAFEKANVLFNIGSKLYNDALKKTTIESLKLQVKTLCTSATVFDWISSNFDHAPLFDISKAISKFFSQLCLLAAQELAFFSAVIEQKGLKVIARISLGLMNFIKSCQNALPIDTKDHDLNYFKSALEVKALFHNSIHCLIMAEFWDSQQLPDIAHDLFMTAKTNLEASLIKQKQPLLDYLSLSIMRSGKEKQQLFGANAKASESKVVVEPFFIASLVDFREVIAPYANTYQSIFKTIYPVKVIEAQSEFETKAQSLVSALLSTLDEPENSLQSHVLNSSRPFAEIIIEFRNQLCGAENLKALRSNAQQKLLEIDEFIKIVVAKHPRHSTDTELSHLVQEYNNLRSKVEDGKIALICNDISFVEALRVALNPSHSDYLKDLRDSSSALESGLIAAQQGIEKLKDQVNIQDIREELLGSADFSQVIENSLKKIEAEAAQILAQIQAQKIVLEKTKRISDAFESSSKSIMLQHFPQLPTIVQEISRCENTIAELTFRLETIANNVNQKLIYNATQNQFLILELLNKN